MTLKIEKIATLERKSQAMEVVFSSFFPAPSPRKYNFFKGH
jgi:hypothetical protein